jgi:type IV pilus assembly protein PilQ
VKYTTLVDYDAQGNLQNSMDIRLPQYRTQELATRVTVKSGETVVMGGVLERQRSTYVESVPVLGDLPLIGALFRRRTEQDIPRYLLIFVTATIVKDTGEFLVYEDAATSPRSNGGYPANGQAATAPVVPAPAAADASAVPTPAPAPANPVVPAPAPAPAPAPSTNTVAPAK